VNRRLYRSRDDRVLTGVGGGLAVYLDVDPSLVRVGWVILAVLTGGVFALVYIVMAVVVPTAPAGWGAPPRRGWGPPPGAPGPSGWGAPTAGAPAAGTPPSAPSGASPGDDATQEYPGPAWPAGEDPAAWTEEPAPGAVPGWRGTDAPTWGTPPDQAPADRGSGTGAPLVFGILLILLGAWFLLRRWINIDFDLIWPVVVIGLGAVLILGAMRRGDR
jgi:phage shock protein C